MALNLSLHPGGTLTLVSGVPQLLLMEPEIQNLQGCEEGVTFLRAFLELGPGFRDKSSVLHEHYGPRPRKDGRFSYASRE